jgi:hypothetical protein
MIGIIYIMFDLPDSSNHDFLLDMLPEDSPKVLGSSLFLDFFINKTSHA